METREVLRHPRAVARHVSAAGCQLILENGALHVGQALGFSLEGAGWIRGQVRWILANHVGFAFDAMLDSGAQAILARHARESGRLDLEILG
ncbi:PilZ domain-containing protein [Novosphingobium profundi]|uniref:PilZ domain-containing protein n=1 Tax=Novosphingobium profundi TaxID=1774954 RepID=UPI001BD9B9E6|nr:PilZ domain-containing protein [Novosphingobium profundi]